MVGSRIKRTVVVVTESYPFARLSERAYFEPEIMELSRQFDKVVIMPRNKREADGEAPFYPNVTVSKAWVEHPDFKNKWRRLRFLMSSVGKGRLKGEKYKKKALTYGMAAWTMSRFFEKWISEEEVDPKRTVFYTFWFDYSTAGLALLKERKFSEMKIVTRVHSYYETSDVAMWWKRLTASKLDGVYPVSDYSRKLYGRCVGGMTASDIIDVIALGCSGKVLPRTNHGEDEIKFFTACRLDTEKRLPEMLEFMDALATARSEKIGWIVAGDGSERGRFMDLIRANDNMNLKIDYRGLLSNEAIHELYDKEGIDWSFLLSPAEGLPIAICEGLMHGVPAVANDVGGVSEAVDDESGLLLAENPTKEEFIRGIAPYLDSSYRYGRLRDGSREKWENEFDAAKLRRVFVERLVGLL